MNKKALSNLFLLLLPIFLLGGCSNSKANTSSSDPISKSEVLMGTFCTVKIYDSKDTKILDKAFDRIKEIENEVSINKENTELDKVNANAGKERVNVKNDTYTIIKKGKEYSKLSSGTFDITIGPIVKLWGIGTDSARLPSEDEIKERLPLINYEDLEIDEKNHSIYLNKKGMVIDLGAIAKGYTADEIAKVLRENNVQSAIIDLGGNIYALGNNSKGNPWKIGVQSPFLERGETIGYVEEKDKSVVTSGIYERYFEQDGKRYHHILNPKDGYPYDNEIAGVTIVSDTSMDGDALSTTLFSLGVEKGLDFINKIPNVDAVFVTKDKDLYITPGLKDIFKLTNKDFKMRN
ncbi:FAD:protein FMN transferase [Clostridium sp. MSJ-4]|uniref:FAD:protein FMN transferase n=1 Tax=Clostridium simiarum TaxID=2841506 RepID=A0ABS6EVL5_9CLOT|nr:FAD:protein FMN transferase [Clostridium simiarum]MBU5590264.1 FAD:protein FMN transferase [Clostridium simiarum]